MNHTDMHTNSTRNHTKAEAAYAQDAWGYAATACGESDVFWNQSRGTAADRRYWIERALERCQRIGLTWKTPWPKRQRKDDMIAMARDLMNAIGAYCADWCDPQTGELHGTETKDIDTELLIECYEAGWSWGADRNPVDTKEAKALVHEIREQYEDPAVSWDACYDHVLQGMRAGAAV